MSKQRGLMEAQMKKFEQQRRRRLAREKQEQVERHKADSRRNFIIGECVARYYPKVMDFVPGRTKAETVAEFALFDCFFKALFSETELVKQLELQATELASAKKLSQNFESGS